MLSEQTSDYASFSVAPNVLTELLGSNLTEDLSIVFAEQIKNSKDANATEVVIDLSKFPSQIIISDNGEGIQTDKIKETWFTAGTTNKSDNPNLLGGKGIGRFTLFALGNKLEIYTTSGNVQSYFTLSKDLMNKAGSVENIKIDIKHYSAKNTRGTTLIIKDLLPEVIDIAKINSDLKNLLLDSSEFSIKIKKPESYSGLPSLMDYDEAIKFATLESIFKLTWNNNGTHTLNHTACAKILDNTTPLNQQNVTGLDDQITSLNDYIDNNRSELKKLGDLTFNLYNFYDKNNNKPEYRNSPITQRQVQKQFLSYNAGINLYRNNFKIFGYGLNDWLGLENESRNKTAKISNTRSVGQIILANESSNYLIEKTNREGLQTSKKSFKGFKELIEHFITIVNLERQALIKNTILEDLAQTPNEKTIDNLSSNMENQNTRPNNTNIKKHPDNKLDKPQVAEPDIVKSNNLKKYHPTISLNTHTLNKKYLCHKSTDLYQFIDFDNSTFSDGTKINKDDLSFYDSEDRLIMHGMLPGPDGEQSYTVVVKAEKDDLFQQFTINFVDSSPYRRSDLFPLNNNSHFKLESDDPNNFFRKIMSQLNNLWTSEHDFNYVVSATIRTITDVEIEDRLRPAVTKHSKNNNNDIVFNSLGNGFTAIDTLVDFILSKEQKHVQNSICKLLDIGKDSSDNFYSKLKPFGSSGNHAISLRERLQLTHIGSHNPKNQSPDRITSLANDIVTFLELSEAFIKVLEDDCKSEEN